MSDPVKPLNSKELARFAEIVGLNVPDLLASPYEDAWFQKRHSIVLYTGEFLPLLSSKQDEGIVIADWLGQKTLRIYPTLPILFARAFQNVIRTNSPFFVQGRNLQPSQFQWVKRESGAKRSLVIDIHDIPLGVGLLRLDPGGREMFINEIDIGRFFRQEKKAKRKMKR